MPDLITEWPHFFTVTNHGWKKLLQPDKYKEIIISSFRFLVNDNRIKLYAFVIMHNHIHLIWQTQAGINHVAVQRDFLKFTAQKIKADLRQFHPDTLRLFKVEAKDRHYQFWKRNPLSIELRSNRVFQQKLEYIHWNPVRAGLCVLPELYPYSSAEYYETGVDKWGILTHYMD